MGPGLLPGLRAFLWLGAPPAPRLPGVRFILILLYACAETAMPKAQGPGVGGSEKEEAGRSPLIFGLWSHAHGHVTSSPADARDKAGRIPMPRARPGTLGIPFQERLGTAANSPAPGGEGPPCSVGKAAENCGAVWGPP